MSMPDPEAGPGICGITVTEYVVVSYKCIMQYTMSRSALG